MNIKYILKIFDEQDELEKKIENDIQKLYTGFRHTLAFKIILHQ